MHNPISLARACSIAHAGVQRQTTTRSLRLVPMHEGLKRSTMKATAKHFS